MKHQKIPAKAYSLGIDWKYSEHDGGYFRATPEKALCDKIYADKRVKNLKEPEVLEYLRGFTHRSSSLSFDIAI
jgi:hypothetical protein